VEVIEQGIGRVFSDPDPDHARQFFQTKSRVQKNKLMDLRDAIAEYVHDGEYFATGGFGANRTPIAACHEILRQGRKDMGFAGHTSTHDFQLFCAGEVFTKLDVAYILGLEARGLSACARRYMESGKVEVCEWTNYALAARLKAAAMGVAFMPIRSMIGTDTLKFSGGKIIECPFTGTKYVAVPALWPDVAIIHVHEADIYGNCRIFDISVADLDLARAAKRVIITCERLIRNDEIRRAPYQTVIPYYCVDAVCEVKFGAYPGVMAYEYFSDEEHLQEWLQVEKDAEQFQKFLAANIYNCQDHMEYINLHGGLKKMLALRHKELLLTATRA
jgi:glutaconate CoA-transferase, subunit A